MVDENCYDDDLLNDWEQETMEITEMYKDYSVRELTEAISNGNDAALIALEERWATRYAPDPSEGASRLEHLWELDAKAQQLVRENYGKLSLQERVDLENIAYARMIEWELLADEEA